MSQLTTLNEVKAALAIGCKITNYILWDPHRYVYLEGSMLINERGIPFIPLTSLEHIMCLGHWEIYHENQRSSTSS